MDKKALRRIGAATLASFSESKIKADPERYFHIAQAAMRAAYNASKQETPNA